MDELETLIEELQESVKKAVSSPPANYVRVHEFTADYAEAAQHSGSVFRDNMNEIERMLDQLEESDYQANDKSAPQRSPASPSFTLESLMNDLKDFQLEHELALSRLSAHQRTLASQSQQGAPASSQSPRPPSTRQAISPSAMNHSPSGGVGQTSGTVCAACGEQIHGQMVQALGRAWHLHHFVCAGGCGSQLSQQTFYEVSNSPYCEPCYQLEFSPKCAQCDGAILDRCLTALGRRWHPEHFFCQMCTAPFSETSGFHEKDGRPYCLDCYSDQFAPKCRGCTAPITANYVTAMASMWHPECFVCQDCGRDLGGGNFYDLSGQPYCEQHYHTRRGTLCVACERAITSRCITAMGRKFHPECFKCAFCNKQLGQGTFKEKESKPYCSDCYGKLFSKK
ncbi:hypothetical protein BOX15_Mlig012898g1 [Macrostomum lignano]|uniref:LIM zinc-binding domain-containing protein n=1 Tax=Macrostomum lignano TaxID=282301 RepID=A0A267H3C0_9PLAT|nr:hypothetical protein BOX15_Mlig012898g1 [Macrostomum lignano]